MEGRDCLVGRPIAVRLTTKWSPVTIDLAQGGKSPPAIDRHPNDWATSPSGTFWMCPPNRTFTPGFQYNVAVPLSVSVTVSVNRVRTWRSMPLLLGRVRGNSAAGPGGRAPSFPRKRVGGAPGAYERQIRKNRTRSYINGWTATANLRKRRTLFFT